MVIMMAKRKKKGPNPVPVELYQGWGSQASFLLPANGRRIQSLLDISGAVSIGDDGTFKRFSRYNWKMQAFGVADKFEFTFYVAIGANGMTCTATDGNTANAIRTDMDTALNKLHLLFQVGTMSGRLFLNQSMNGANGQLIARGVGTLNLLPWIDKFQTKIKEMGEDLPQIFLIGVCHAESGKTIYLDFYKDSVYEEKPIPIKM
jgi:hypothetical protein